VQHGHSYNGRPLTADSFAVSCIGLGLGWVTEMDRRTTLTYTIRCDSVYLTCSKKLTGSQLSLPHGMNKKLKRETKNKLMKPTRKAFRTWFRRFVDCSHCLHLEVPQQHLHILRMHPHRKLPSLQQNSRRLICKKILANNTINKCVSKTHSAIPGEGSAVKTVRNIPSHFHRQHLRG